jgi:fermentation-respiration switch protein FrsA (DUF1100 family)
MMRRLALRVLLWCLGAYLAICAFMFGTQRQLLFHPDPRDVALDVQQVPGARVERLHTSDGETLLSWWVPPATDKSAVYLYLHGNADTLAARAERLAFLSGQGAGVLAVSWRGYGGSTGTPSEAGLRRDALAAYEWLTARVEPRRVIVFGESLGTALAVGIAAEHESAALVLDSAFTSIADVARGQYPWLPVDLLLRDRLDSLAFAPRITVPVRTMHCTQDPVVPYALGMALFDAFPSSDKTLTSVEGRCHVPSVAPLGPALRALEQRVKVRP